MSGTILIGTSYGDEGKGKVIDYFSEKADIVVRYSGGANAGHTLVVNGKKTVLRLVPSGILQPHTVCVLAQGMAIDPLVLKSELESLTEAGIDWHGRVFVSSKAHVVMPYHIWADAYREGLAQNKIGTTKKGIGPCYEDKISRRGIRITDLQFLAKEHLIAKEHFIGQYSRWIKSESAIHHDNLKQIDLDIVFFDRMLASVTDVLKPLITDTAELINSYLKKGKHVLFEGAQGSLLDIDHGTYPFVTSSSSTAGGACTGSGVGPTWIDKVVGVTKAYTTRVGEGPFDTEINDEVADYIRKAGNEFGSVTGRPRRIGWLDLEALKSVCMINGISELVVTKIDVLTGLNAVMIKVGSNQHGPKYISFPGWKEDLSQIKSVSDLPFQVKDILTFIESELHTPVTLVSVGPERDQIMEVDLIV